MASIKDKRSIFDTIEQRVDWIDPAAIRLQGDRVLLRDIPGVDRIGLIWLPERCQDQEILRQSEVVAVGPGDSCIERPIHQDRYDSEGRVQLRRLPLECERLPMSVRPGQRVLYSRRLEAEVFINGERYAMVHEEQAIFAIMRGDHESRTIPRPLRDRVIVSRDRAHQKTPGGLYIPQGSQEERPEGIVLAVGPGRFKRNGSRIGPDVEVGDHVVFAAHAGSDFEIRGERLLIMRESDIEGVLE